MAAPVQVGNPPQVAVAPPPRKRRRWSAGHIVMIVAGLLGAALTLLALQAADARVTISVATTDLAAGTRIAPGTFTTKQVRLDNNLRAAIVNPDNAAGFVGATLLVPVKAGQPVPTSALVNGATADGRRSLSMPIAPERAVGGKLRNGDRVDIYTTGSKGALISTNVEILDVMKTDDGPLSAKKSLTIVLAVTSDQATRIAPIVGSDDVVLVQATGATGRTTTTATPTAPTLTPLPPGTPVAPTPEVTPGG